MTREIDTKRHLNDIFADIPDFIAISDCIDPEFRMKTCASEEIRREMRIQTAESWGLDYWEKILNISSSLSDSAADRRFRILMRRLERLPYTKRGIIRNLEGIVGEGRVVLDIDEMRQTAKCYIDLRSAHLMREVDQALGRMMQAHVAYTVMPLYNTHNKLNELNLTHEALEPYTHTEVREHYFG